MDDMMWNLDEALQAKEERRRLLSALSYKEKVKIVIRLQEMAVPLLLAQGRKVSVWKTED